MVELFVHVYLFSFIKQTNAHAHICLPPTMSHVCPHPPLTHTIHTHTHPSSVQYGLPGLMLGPGVGQKLGSGQDTSYLPGTHLAYPTMLESSVASPTDVA